MGFDGRLFSMKVLILFSLMHYAPKFPNAFHMQGSKEYETEAVEKVGKCITNFGVKQVMDSDRLSSPIPLPASNVKSSPGRELYYM